MKKKSLKQRARCRALCFIRINLGGFMKKLVIKEYVIVRVNLLHSGIVNTEKIVFFENSTSTYDWKRHEIS